MDVDDLDDATLVAGAPRSGKTRFALDMLVAAMKRHGDAYAVMTVSGRQVADRLGDTVIRELSAISQARPVTTLPAVAFRIMTAVRSHAGQPLPKLLNGAEQDVVIRRVLDRHAEHAEHGDECSTCALLRTYFVVADWSGMVVDDATDAFANQLRDMLARMNEIGAKPELEDALISRAADEHGTLDERRERLRVQWRLAFALRAEYNQAINEAYPDQYRLDASQLMIDAAAAVNEAKRPTCRNSSSSTISRTPHSPASTFSPHCATVACVCCSSATPTRRCRRSADRTLNICSTWRNRDWARDWYGWNRPIWPKARTWPRWRAA